MVWRKKKIATFHEAFPYFAQEFDLHIVTVISREPGSEPSAEELAATVKTIKNTGGSRLFLPNRSILLGRLKPLPGKRAPGFIFLIQLFQARMIRMPIYSSWRKT